MRRGSRSLRSATISSSSTPSLQVSTLCRSAHPTAGGSSSIEHIHEGAGEVEDLYQMALEVEAAFKIDPNRRYVTGLSSGAGMAVDLAVAHSEYFAAAGSVEGLPYSETSSSVALLGCQSAGAFQAGFGGRCSPCGRNRAGRTNSDRSRSWPFMPAMTARSI